MGVLPSVAGVLLVVMGHSRSFAFACPITVFATVAPYDGEAPFLKILHKRSPGHPGGLSNTLPLVFQATVRLFWGVDRRANRLTARLRVAAQKILGHNRRGHDCAARA